MALEYTVAQIEAWLFGGVIDPSFPKSKLQGRNQAAYQAKINSAELHAIGDGPCTRRVRIHSGSITDIKIESGKRAAVTSSNNGDLLTGCGFAVAKAVINAAGAGLQAELYNSYGVPSVMQVPIIGPAQSTKEGRGYALSCDAYDMRQTHNVERIEVLTVPMHDAQGVENMYYDALLHCKDLDYIILPMAGMTHPVINNIADKSAEFTFNAIVQFMKDYPDSKLQVIFTIFNDPLAETCYTQHAIKKDEELILTMSLKTEELAEDNRMAVDLSVQNMDENLLLETQKTRCNQLINDINQKMRAGSSDSLMDMYIKTHIEKIKVATSNSELATIEQNLSLIVESSQQVYCIKEKINAFRESSSWWKLAVGKKAKAEAIETALSLIPIDERAKALDNKQLQEELARHRHWGKQHVIYKKADASLDEVKAAQSFKDLKNRFGNLESRQAPDDEVTPPNKPSK